MKAIVCVGETIDQRRAGRTLPVIVSQVETALRRLGSDQFERVVIAYEPVWAIGTGLTASPDDAQEAHAAIRGQVADGSGPEVANALRILYGGSVKPDNAASLLAQPDVDGALVGGASLSVESFLGIIEAAG
jgi:triosephosphate isomerase